MFPSIRSFRTTLLNFPPKVTKFEHLKSFHTGHLFDETPQREIFFLNSLLTSYLRDNDYLAAWSLFHHMHSSSLNLNAYTFTPVLTSCSALPGPERGKQVHSLIIKLGIDSSTVTKTALLDMYSKHGYVGESVLVFEEMEFKDVVAWNALFSSFSRHGLFKQALGVFEVMRKERVEFSEFTLCSMLKACTFTKAFRQGKQVHGLVIVMGRDMVVLCTSLIDFYCNLGCVDEAFKVYSTLNCRKDDIMRNSLVSGCVRNRKYAEAFSIMCEMRPNAIALTSALAACSENSDLWAGKQIQCVAIRHKFTSSTQLCNVLLDMYAKCGNLSTARNLFNGIRDKDVVSWTSMIQAYGSQGQGLKAFELFKIMGGNKTKVSPNSVTVLAVLSACAHSGLVEQGRECFNLAKEKYGLDLGPEHYACFIDILGRAGRNNEAWSLLNSMIANGAKPNAAIWAALLNSCSHNLDVKRGESAAKHLLQLEPNKPANYVLVSNFYASVGKWDKVDDLRSVMRMKGLLKEAGSSWL